MLVGAAHEIVALVSPGVAMTLEGGCGGKIIRETVALPELATHTLDPSGLTTMPWGTAPTVIEVTALLEVAMRETLALPEFDTHTLDPSGLTARPEGPFPTLIGVMALSEVSMRETVPLK